MLKIGLVLAVLLGIALALFPQLRSGVPLLLPFALLVLCLLICPLVIYFGMNGMSERKDKDHE